MRIAEPDAIGGLPPESGSPRVIWLVRLKSSRRRSWRVTRMKSEGEEFAGGAVDRRVVRNPFGVIDVPGPNDLEVLAAYAAAAVVDGSTSDENATAWSTAGARDRHSGIEGIWSSRWNGGVDGTIPGDARDKWKQGQAEVRTSGERVYLLFDWNNGSRRGLIEARYEDARRLVGKYINLADPAITRPWGGLIVSDRRIDGAFGFPAIRNDDAGLRDALGRNGRALRSRR
jgi:hypothetical protein